MGAGAQVDAVQYFWEAFPAGGGAGDRTTYMFAYLDADERRPSLLALMDDYWRLMPAYQVGRAFCPCRRAYCASHLSHKPMLCESAEASPPVPFLACFTHQSPRGGRQGMQRGSWNGQVCCAAKSCASKFVFGAFRCLDVFRGSMTFSHGYEERCQCICKSGRGVQGVELEDLQPQRILFGFFPTFRNSPLKPRWDRILQARPSSACVPSTACLVSGKLASLGPATGRWAMRQGSSRPSALADLAPSPATCPASPKPSPRPCRCPTSTSG